MKEIWLRSQTVFRAADGKIHMRDAQDYLVNPQRRWGNGKGNQRLDI